MSQPPVADAEVLAKLRSRAIAALRPIVGPGPLDLELLTAINAITAYGHAQLEYHDARSSPNESPVWFDPWDETWSSDG